MKKTTIMFMAIAIAATMVIPVLTTSMARAGGAGVIQKGTGTTITIDSGSIPIVKAKWEATNLTYQDDSIATGIQVDPVLLGKKIVYYFAVVTQDLITNVDTVWWDVYHPDGSFKYQFKANYMYSAIDAMNLWKLVYAKNPSIITINPSHNEYDYVEILTELSQGNARIYRGQANLSYCQPAGNYSVNATVYDKVGHIGYLNNKFLYVYTLGVEYDFQTLQYDANGKKIYLNSWNQLDGDYIWNPPSDTHPTVRVTGNVPVNFSVAQDHMGFNFSGTVPNVLFRARLGDINSNYVEYPPNQWYNPLRYYMIPGHLPLCTMEKLDFWIDPLKLWLGHVTYTGNVYLWAFQWDGPIYHPPDYNNTANHWLP